MAARLLLVALGVVVSGLAVMMSGRFMMAGRLVMTGTRFGVPAARLPSGPADLFVKLATVPRCSRFSAGATRLAVLLG